LAAPLTHPDQGLQKKEFPACGNLASYLIA
jgi:hypothetical protein